MRDFKNMKRQRGRNRSSGGGGSSSGGGGKPQQNANRAFDSNGPDNVKIRGHAQHVFEKYQQYARDAFSSGDRVLAENYLQHADHYFRVLRTIQPQRSPSEILGRDVLASGLDIDFEEEFEPNEDGAETQGEGGGDANGGDGRREDRYEPRRESEGQSRDSQYRDSQFREGQSRENGSRDRNDNRRDSYEGREPRGEVRQDRYGEGPPRIRNDSSPARTDSQYPRERTDGQYRDRQDGRERTDRQEGGDTRRDNRRFEPRRDERPYARDNRFEERRPDERGAGEVANAPDPLPLVAPVASAPSFPISAPDAEASPVLRSEDGGVSEAPAFLQPAGGEDAALRKPRARRRRTPASFEPSEGDGGAQTAPSTESQDA